jgi:O-antigen/teichoic acid export membrane protein
LNEIGAKIGSGSAWNLVNLLLSRGASIVFTLLLTRLLAPEAFGIIAMMSVFFELANIVVNSGLQQALIRSSSVSETDLSTAFFSNILFSAFAYLCLFFIAPVAASFYEQPALTNLIRVAGIVLFVNSLIIVQDTLLRRQLRFRAIMYATVTGAIASGGLALVLAYSGFGVWSLVVQMVTARLFTGLVVWHQGTWRPTWDFSTASFGQMFRFGYKLLFESTIDVLYRNSFFVVIGKLFSAELAGLYFLASKINDMVAPQISDAVAQASFPALSKLQDKSDDLRQTYRRIISITMFLISPLIAGMAVLSPLVFDVLMDPEWRQSAIFLQFFSLMGLLFPLHTMNYNVLTVKGRSDLVLWLGILRKSVNVVVLILCIPYGIYGILTGQIITSILALGPNTYYTAKLIDYGLATQLSDIIRPVIAASVSGSLVLILISTLPQEPAVLLILGSTAGLFSYAIIGRLICRPDFMAIKQYIIDNTLRPLISKVD